MARNKVAGRWSGLVEYHPAGVIGRSYAAAEGSSLDDLASLVGWGVSLAQGENSYGAGDWREEQQQAEDYSHATGTLQRVLDYEWIYESWRVDIDGDGQAEEAWDFGNPHQYPALRIDFNNDNRPTWQEFGPQRREPQATGLGRLLFAGLEQEGNALESRKLAFLVVKFFKGQPASHPPKNLLRKEPSTNDGARSTLTLIQNDLLLGEICVRHPKLDYERKYAFEFVRCVRGKSLCLSRRR